MGALSGADALKLGAAASRRSFTSKAASNPQFGPGGKNAVKNPFDGKFSDPAHSDLPRKISWIGGRDYQIDGADEDKVKWVVVAKRKNAKTLIADFSSKGGPEGVVVTALNNGDISFPDGNVWKKLYGREGGN